MLKRIAVIYLALIFMTASASIVAPPANAASASLSAPAGISVSVAGTQFIIRWQNPADVSRLAISAYKNYNGALFYIVDWRVNRGPWHYDREVPGEQDFFSYYPEMQKHFHGQLCDSYGEIAVPRTIIDKVLVGVPYNMTIKEWLKKNSVEFRVRYLYNYYSDSSRQMENQYSAFSKPFFLGTYKPEKNQEPGPAIGKFGVPVPPSAISSPQELESEYMTLNLNLKVPEDIKTLTDMNLWPVITAIDWKMNDGEWYVATNALSGLPGVEYILNTQALVPDKNGYVTISLSRDALKIPFGTPLNRWLGDNTYYIRARFVLMCPDGNETRYIFSSYSNTVTLGRGTLPPK